jgi:hypothetical protein
VNRVFLLQPDVGFCFNDESWEFAGEETNHRDYTEAATRLGTSPGAVAVAVHRLRQRYRELLLAEIQPTVANPEHVEAELRHLVSSLQS